MNVRVERACGIDVHKSFLVATMLTCEGVKETKEFNTGLEDLINLREWIMERHNTYPYLAPEFSVEKLIFLAFILL